MWRDVDSNLISVLNFQYLKNIQTFIFLDNKGNWICTAPHCEKLASEVLRYGSHSCYTANSPYLPLPCSIHQMAPPV